MKPIALQVVCDFLPFSYGEQAALLAPALQAYCDPQFFTTGTAGLKFVPGQVDGYPHESCPVHPRNWPGAAWALRQRICRQPPAVVHAWGPRAAQIAAWAVAGLWTGSAPGLVVRYHRDEPPASAALGALQVLDWRSRLDQVVEGMRGDPQSGRDPLQAWSTWDARQAPSPNGGPSLRARLQIDTQVGLVGVVSPMEVRRGLKHLVWGTDLVHWVRDLRLVVWGTGPQQADLRRYAQQIANRDHYLWLSPDNPVRQQLLELDVLWDPSRRGLSPAAHTAVAYGIPVITFTPPELLDSQLDRELVQCVPWGARDELARATIRLLEQPRRTPEFRSPHPDTAAIAAAYARLYSRWAEG